MSQRFRGRSHGALLRKLPRNLVLFDGRCRLSQARVQYVLERNFSYFSFLRLARGIDAATLEANKMFFCSFDSAEWREVRRHFGRSVGDAAGVVLVEKVPSEAASFLRRGGEEEADVDVLVSTKYTAVCRIGMKLDRWLPRTLFACLYYLVPQRVGDYWFDRALRRRRLWGTSEEDAVRFPKRILGLKERTWKL